MIHIYDEKLNYLIGLNYEYEDFKKNPSLYYPDWQIKYYASPTKYEYPIIVDDIIREMTREEKITILKMEKLLEDGEYIEKDKIIKVEYDEKLGYLKRAWNKEIHIWYEGATEKELKEKYYQLINDFKNDILETGYVFRGHQQKVREKDKSWLSLRIMGMERTAFKDKKLTAEFQLLVPREQLDKEEWVFDTGEIESFDILDLHQMLQDGDEWSSAIFKAEQILKAKQANILITKNEFIEEIIKHTKIKCWEETKNVKE